jgi:hypothetical protein
MSYEGYEKELQAELLAFLKETPEWVEFESIYAVNDPRNQALLDMLAADKLGSDPNVSDYQRLIRAVIQAGGVVRVGAEQYEFVELPTVASVVQPEVSRDRNGNVLTVAQQAWSEYRTYSESHSMQEIRNRARVDSNFASFVQKQYERETSEVADAVTNLNAKAPRSNEVPDNIREFATKYRVMPTSEIRRLSRYDSNPEARNFNFLRDEAIRLGLI